jgi:NADPH:quinone reductase
MTTKQIVLAARPAGKPAADNFRIEAVELPAIAEGEVLLKGLYYSVDPYMRGRMNDAASYVPPFQLNQPIEGGVVAEVTESRSGMFKPGDIVTGMLPWSEHFVGVEKKLVKVDTTVASASYYLGVMGMPGLTAYFGLLDICKPKPGETVVVSGAAGAVGIVVGQLAKLHGCRVVGIAGSDAKVKLLTTEFGFDAAINYKTTTSIRAAIAAACPNGVDIYFDNVGGEISDAVIAEINFNARIALCGQVSLYNNAGISTGPRLQPILLTKSVLMQGFIIGNYKSRFAEGINYLAKNVQEGKIKFTETIMHGFEKLPAAFLGLFTGENTGKMIVQA